jgi:hypothetical protein
MFAHSRSDAALLKLAAWLATPMLTGSAGGGAPTGVTRAVARKPRSKFTFRRNEAARNCAKKRPPSLKVAPED